MTKILVLGAGLNGLTTAMLLTKDGHNVTVLERDPAPAPPSASVWQEWDRPGISQFRGAHFMQPRWHAEMRAELPEVLEQLIAVGGRPTNTSELLNPVARGERLPDDDRFATVAARRPVLEAALASVAARMPGLEIHRGVRVTGLVARGRHVAGVHAIAGDRAVTFTADLVVDCTGRRSQLPSWLTAAGLAAPAEERADAGFVYFGRHFHGTLPAPLAPLLQKHNSISIITVPCDNDTWAVAFVASSRDSALRSLRDPERWNALLARYPTAAHWTAGDPITDVVVMGGLNDHRRRYVVGAEPVATGVVALGDSAYFTNPALGRGASMGVLHAQVLRDLLRETSNDDPVKLILQFAERSDAVIDPLFRATNWLNQHRLAEVDADIAGTDYRPDDAGWDMVQAAYAAGLEDPACARAFLSSSALLDTGTVRTDKALAHRVLSIGAGAPRYPSPGPDRAELLTVVG